jgi:GTPase
MPVSILIGGYFKMYDHVEIKVSSGKGGDGSSCFRREKFVPFGGPDGGDGGLGGAIIFRADASLTGLAAYRSQGRHRAENGVDGRGQKRHGRNGEDLMLKVPPGTVIKDVASDAILADLESDGDEFTVVTGGRGGRGNVHYATSTAQAPRLRQRGEEGTELPLKLEMRLIADVGVIGYPNAGKSTLLTAASAARPKVADYPFTTLEPVLGTVTVGERRMVLAEIPGLIAGAHRGRGLGHEFLRHIMRTRILIHLIDGSSATPQEDLANLNVELSLYDIDLGKKPQLLAINKIDLPQVRERRESIAADLSAVGIKVNFVSAQTGEGTDELMADAMELLRAQPKPEPKAEGEKVFRPQARNEVFQIQREDEVFIVSWPDLERVECGAGGSKEELAGYLRRRLQRAGFKKAILAAGARPGDKVRLGRTEWAWW